MNSTAKDPNGKPVENIKPNSRNVTSDTPTHETNDAQCSLYVRNLNDKINKKTLRTCLYMLFSDYGHVIDIVALKTPKMRGQAHIAFKDAQIASQALKALQGFEFLGKKMVGSTNPITRPELTLLQVIEFAKTKSNKLAMLDGTFKMPDMKKDLASDEPEESETGTNAAPVAPAESKDTSGAEAKATPVAPSASAGHPKIPSTPATNGVAGERGVKRKRDENEEPVQVEEEDDDEAEMDVSDDDD